MKSHKIVHVEWLDASSTNAWTDLEELEAEANLTHTVGFLVKETEDFMLVAATYDQSTQSVNAIMSIPLVCIKHTRTLGRVKL